MRWLAIVVMIWGCGGRSGDNRADGRWNGAGDTVGTVDPGSGSAAGLYWVRAVAEGSDEWISDQRFYRTRFLVDLGDDAALPVTDAYVEAHTRGFGDVVLEERADRPGRYEGEMFGYDRTFSLLVTTDEGDFGATAVGPAIHRLQLPAEVDPSAELDIRWDPAGAGEAEIETRRSESSIPDTGHHVLAAGTLDAAELAEGDEYVRLWRGETLDLTGAVPSSSFEVSIRVEDLLVPQGSTQPGPGFVEGRVRLDNDLASLDGLAFVLAWPVWSSDPGVDPYAAWDGMGHVDADAEGNYRTGPLTPGEWHLVAYIDADGSDAGLERPAGPTDGDPFEDRTVQVAADQTTRRDFDLQDRW